MNRSPSQADGGNHRNGASRVRAYWLLGWLLAFAGLIPCRGAAQTNTAKAASSGRCLIIVDTSRAMQRRTEATLKAVEDLVTSGLEGQLRRGDTLGLWTFNQTLYAGRFPLQTWSPESRKEIAARMVAFLKAQKCQKSPQFDKVLPAVNLVVERSKGLTVILISSGDETIRGTPYDDQIRKFYDQWREQQQKARMPFVTVLRAQKGRFADVTLNLAPWPVQFPKLPQETETAETTQKKPQEAVRKTQPTSAPPLIVSGKKAPAQQAPAPKTGAATVKPSAPTPLAPPATTNEPVVAKPPEPSAPPTQVAKAENVPVVPDTPPTPGPPKPGSSLKVEAVPTPGAKPAEPSPAKPGDTSSPPAQLVKPAPAENAQAKPTPPPEPAKPPPPPAQAATATNATSNAVAPASVSPRTSAPAPPPVQTATAAPAETLVSRTALWIAAVGVALVAGACILVLLLHRSRTAPQGSLITRSYERRKDS